MLIHFYTRRKLNESIAYFLELMIPKIIHKAE